MSVRHPVRTPEELKAFEEQKQIKAEQQAQAEADRRKVYDEHRAAAAVTRAKTDRLRAERLAREEAEAKTFAEAKALAEAAQPKKRRKAKPASPVIGEP